MRSGLSRHFRELRRHWVGANPWSIAEFVLIALLALQGARLIWAIVTPVAPFGNWRPAQPDGGALTNFDPFFRLSEESAPPGAVTSLQLTLFGIRLNEASGAGSAIIAAADGTQKSYQLGEEIMPGVRLKAVAFDHVSIDHGGTIEDLYIDQSRPVAPVEPPADKPVHSLPDLNPGGMSLDAIRTGIGFIPRVDDGKVTGLVVRPEGNGQVFARAGLQQGDIITEVMGKPVTGPETIAGLKGQFSNGGILSFTIERGGQKMPIGINMVGR